MSQEADLDKERQSFRLWREKRVFPEDAIEKATGLRLFKEKYGVDKGSNFHCPWCFTGRLYKLGEPPVGVPEGDYYVCRGCELIFKLECLNQSTLDQLIEAKKEERRKRKLSTEETELVNELIKEALDTGHITCRGCGTELSSDTEYCTCGWKNLIVGLGGSPS